MGVGVEYQLPIDYYGDPERKDGIDSSTGLYLVTAMRLATNHETLMV